MTNAQKIAQEETAAAEAASAKASTAQETITSTSQASALEETVAPMHPATITEQTAEQFKQLQANELQANAQLLIDQASASPSLHRHPQHHPTGKEGENPAIEATPEIIAAVQELRRIEELKKKLLELEEARRCQIKSFMGLHPLLTTGAFTLVSWKSANRKSLNIQAFKSELPDLYNSYLTDINVRVFRLC